MRVMIVAAHPDDEVIGCGGTLLRLRRAGADLRAVYLTSGDAGSREMARSEMAVVREREATACAARLGISECQFLRAPDGLLAETPDLLVSLIDLVRRWRPDIAFVPHALDGHPDHRAVHAMAVKAFGSAAGPWFPETSGEPWTVPTVMGYEIWTPLSRPTYYSDTTDTIEDQLRAVAIHASQIKDYAYEQMVAGLAAFRGASIGIGRSAEAFEVLRLADLPGVDDLLRGTLEA
jgi:N-acetylglucosamine malate deacetylase 1